MLQEYEWRVSVMLDGAFLTFFAEVPQFDFERVQLRVDERCVGPLFGWRLEWCALIKPVLEDRPTESPRVS